MIYAWFQTVNCCPFPPRMSTPGITLPSDLSMSCNLRRLPGFSCFCRRLFYIYNGCIIAHDQMGNPVATITDSKLNGRFLQFISLRRSSPQSDGIVLHSGSLYNALPAANPFLRCLPSGFCPAFDSQQRAFQHFLRIPGRALSVITRLESLVGLYSQTMRSVSSFL